MGLHIGMDFQHCEGCHLLLCILPRGILCHHHLLLFQIAASCCQDTPPPQPQVPLNRQWFAVQKAIFQKATALSLQKPWSMALFSQEDQGNSKLTPNTHSYGNF